MALTLGIVIIGRNEGERLVRCLGSLPAQSEACVVYVDSGSTDGSVRAARQAGADVVELDLSVPFTAARARNAGLRRLQQINPSTDLVQFIDGDCETIPGWFQAGVATLTGQSDVGIVCGQVIERRPEASVYNTLCHLEWQQEPGEVRSCGGIFMCRTAVIAAAGLFREDIIAGEEPELCVRVRRRGYKILRKSEPMVWHDADMLRFGQWWKRATRAGHAYAHGASLHGASPERHCVRDCRRIWFWSVIIPTLAFGLSFLTRGYSLLLLGAYPLVVLKVYLYGRRRRAWPRRSAALYAIFSVLAKFPGLVGLLRFHRDRIFGYGPVLIEYKGPTRSANPTP